MKRFVEILKTCGAAVLLALLFSAGALGQNANLQAFTPNGNTITFTAATSAPTPVQAVSAGGNSQYVITNIGSVTAFISFGSSADATANCAIPTSTTYRVIPILANSQFVMTTFSSSYFCGLTASGTAIIYVTPGIGS